MPEHLHARELKYKRMTRNRKVMVDRAKALSQIDGQQVFICVHDTKMDRVFLYQSDEKFDVKQVGRIIDRAAKKGEKSLRYANGGGASRGAQEL